MWDKLYIFLCQHFLIEKLYKENYLSHLCQKKRFSNSFYSFCFIYFVSTFFFFCTSFQQNFKGEKPAAMQHPDKTTAATSSSSTLSAVHYILLPTIPATVITTNYNNNNTNRNNTSIATFQFFIFNIMTVLLAVRNVLFKKIFYLYC